VLSVLEGDRNEKVLARGHQGLSTYGILAAHPRTQLRDWIYQLVGAGALTLGGDPFPVLSLNEESWQILRGQQQARLVRTRRAAERRLPRVAAASREGVDEELFESLRAWRRALAAGRGVPPFVILGDAALRDIARRRPQSPAELLACHGIGEVKLGQFGESILAAVRAAAG
jgi:ATP-dependent DNA helicase RecQ